MQQHLHKTPNPTRPQWKQTNYQFFIIPPANLTMTAFQKIKQKGWQMKKLTISWFLQKHTYPIIWKTESKWFKFIPHPAENIQIKQANSDLDNITLNRWNHYLVNASYQISSAEEGLGVGGWEREREEPDVYIERDGERASGILPVKPCTARRT